jgi:membrane-associated phospholipid phosphatase
MCLLLFVLQLQGDALNELRPWLYVGFLVFLNTIFLPLSLIWMLKRQKIIQSMSLERKEERIYPFFITAIFYFITWYVFNSLGIFPFLSLIFIISMVLVMAATTISFLWKISIHSMSMGAMSIAVLYLHSAHYISSTWPVYTVILLSGLVASSRRKLQAHTAAQVYGGYLLGTLLTALVFWVEMG